MIHYLSNLLNCVLSDKDSEYTQFIDWFKVLATQILFTKSQKESTLWDFNEMAMRVNETQVLSILTVYSSKDNAFYTRHEGGINVIDMAWCCVVCSYSKGARLKAEPCKTQRNPLWPRMLRHHFDPKKVIIEVRGSNPGPRGNFHW